MLAVYLHRGRSFRDLTGPTEVQKGAWDELNRKPKFGRRKLADRASYAWDGLIDFLAGELEGEGLEFGSPGEMESLLRVMDGEDRFARRGSAELCASSWTPPRQKTCSRAQRYHPLE